MQDTMVKEGGIPAGKKSKLKFFWKNEDIASKTGVRRLKIFFEYKL